MRTTDTAPRPKEKGLCVFSGGGVDRSMGHRSLAAALLLVAGCHRTPLGFVGYLGDAGASLGRDTAEPVIPDAAADLATPAPDLPPDLPPPPPDAAPDLQTLAPDSPPVMPPPDPPVVPGCQPQPE